MAFHIDVILGLINPATNCVFLSSPVLYDEASLGQVNWDLLVQLPVEVIVHVGTCTSPKLPCYPSHPEVELYMCVTPLWTLSVT